MVFGTSGVNYDISAVAFKGVDIETSVRDFFRMSTRWPAPTVAGQGSDQIGNQLLRLGLDTWLVCVGRRFINLSTLAATYSQVVPVVSAV